MLKFAARDFYRFGSLRKRQTPDPPPLTSHWSKLALMKIQFTIVKSAEVLDVRRGQ